MSEGTSQHVYLLDTHTAIWALERPEAMTPAARRAVISGPNVLSVVTYWEVMVKSMKGRLDVGDPRAWWLEALDELAATQLPVRADHVSAVIGLPAIHKDPFDRIIIAQAMVEGLTLVSMDSDVARYASKKLHVVS